MMKVFIIFFSLKIINGCYSDTSFFIVGTDWPTILWTPLVHFFINREDYSEENDIILLSLVRSNPQNRIGYLSEANRICVALSRAKKGLYVIGNFEQLKTKSKLWEKIVDDAIKRLSEHRPQFMGK
jgi:hypothetical protein